MAYSKITPVVLGTLLAASLAPASVGAADASHAGQPTDGLSLETAGLSGTETLDVAGPQPSDASSNSESAGTQGSAASEEEHLPAAEAPAEASGVTLVRGAERIPAESLPAAFKAAQTGDVVEVAGSVSITEPVVLDAGRAVTLRAASSATITRAAGYPQEGGKAAGMFRVLGGASLTLEAVDPDAGELVLDGAGADSNEAVATVREGSSFTMRAGTAIERAQCSWKPWGAVYVHGGTFVLDGGELRGGFAMRNAAVAVERGATFEMRAGAITGNRTSYSQSIVWTKGVVRMTGGTIAGNSSNVSSDGVVHVLDGGTLSIAGGTIGNNNPNNTFGIRVDANASLELGEGARLEGADRINLAQGAALSFAGAPTAHSVDDPIEVVLSGTWADGSTVAATSSPEVARAALERLSIKRSGTPETTASVGIDPADDARISLATSDVVAAFDQLDHPFADNLALDLREELSQPGAVEGLRAMVEAHFAGIDTPERRIRLQQVDRIERYAAYLEANREALSDSVQTASQLGDPWAEARRTNQGYQFDNLDATGLHLKPGQKNEIVVYVDADDPSKLAIAWRQVGLTDTSNYPSLNMEQRSKLVNGENRITIDLTTKTYGSMLYLRNNSTDNSVRVRIEAADAPDVAAAAVPSAEGALGGGAALVVAGQANPILGTSLGEHPFYEHDPAHPERFWTYVQDIRAYAELARAGKVADMTLIQMGDDGHAQFAISATAMAKAYEGLTSEADAKAYIERSNTAIQNRLEFYWAFDGFDAGEASGPNAITTARVHTAFTRTVSSPSTMYAYGSYFHMPESSAASFLSGESMYGWGMSHEYGHMLDNNVIAVAEETNNLYSIAGSRHGGIEEARTAGIAFNPSRYYHVNAMNATKRRDAELARMAEDPSYVPDWMNGGDWGTYIWTHVTTWWNGLHFFDSWDYSDYDFSASPYTEQIAADVKKYGAYGATVRILRGDPDAVKTIQDLASNAATGVKYNRMAVAFTMGTGYNFAEYLYELGERDLAPQVLEWCAQYPSMPRKVRYFSLDTDAAIINGAKSYAELVGSDGTVEPELEVTLADGVARVRATMPNDDLAKATCAWELYRNGELVGFSRDGAFEVAAEDLAGTNDPETPGAGVTPLAADSGASDTPGHAGFSVVAYDVRLNPSTDFAPDDDVENGGGEQPGGDGSGEVAPPENGDGENGGETNPPGNGGGDGSDGDDQAPPSSGGSGDGDASNGGAGDNTEGDGEEGGPNEPDGSNPDNGSQQPGGDGGTDEKPDDGQGGTGDVGDGPGTDPGDKPEGDVPDLPDTPGGEGSGGSDDDGEDGSGDTGSTEDGSGTGSPGQPGGDDGEGPSNGAAGSGEAGSEGSDEPGDHVAGTDGRGEALAQTGDASALLAGTGAIGAAIAFIAAAIVRRSRTS